MELVIAPSAKLRIETKPVKKVTPELLKTTKNMIKLTKAFKDPEGVGLASTQIGKDGRYFIAKTEEGKFKAFFNPKILAVSKRCKKMMEGCLSIPNHWGEVSRHIWVKVSYTNEAGKQAEEKLTGLLAHIFQHECDHLSGKLFVDRVLREKGKLYKVVGRDKAGDDIYKEVTI